MTTEGFTLSMTSGSLVCAEIGVAAPKHSKMTIATRVVCNRTRRADARRGVDQALTRVDCGIMRPPFAKTVPVPTVGSPILDAPSHARSVERLTATRH